MVNSTMMLPLTLFTCTMTWNNVRIWWRVQWSVQNGHWWEADQLVKSSLLYYVDSTLDTAYAHYRSLTALLLPVPVTGPDSCAYNNNSLQQPFISFFLLCCFYLLLSSFSFTLSLQSSLIKFSMFASSYWVMVFSISCLYRNRRWTKSWTPWKRNWSGRRDSWRRARRKRHRHKPNWR